MHPDAFEDNFASNMVLIWAVPVLMLVIKMLSGLAWLVVEVLRFLMS